MGGIEPPTRGTVASALPTELHLPITPITSQRVLRNRIVEVAGTLSYEGELNQNYKLVNCFPIRFLVLNVAALRKLLNRNKKRRITNATHRA